MSREKVSVDVTPMRHDWRIIIMHVTRRTNRIPSKRQSRIRSLVARSRAERSLHSIHRRPTASPPVHCSIGVRTGAVGWAVAPPPPPRELNIFQIKYINYKYKVILCSHCLDNLKLWFKTDKNYINTITIYKNIFYT